VEELDLNLKPTRHYKQHTGNAKILKIYVDSKLIMLCYTLQTSAIAICNHLNKV